MQLAPMRFTRIEGTTVSVSVTSAEEAKAALKELRHKKRELKFLRGALLKQKRAMRPRRAARKAKPKSGFGVFLDDMRWGLSAMVEQATGSSPPARRRTPAEIDREIKRTDEVLHNIEGCILQLEGKLLTRG